VTNALNPPTCAINPATATLCEGISTNLTVTITANDGTAPIVITWTKNGAAFDGSSATITAAAPAPGVTDTYVAQIVSANGCTNTCTASVRSNPNPTCDINPKNAVCGGSTNTYTATVSPSGGTVTHSWSLVGNGTIVGLSTAASVTAVAGASGSYTLTDNITRDGCPGQCNVTIPVNPNPNCSISGATDVLVGTTNTYTTTVTPAGGLVVTHSWTVSANGSIVGPADQPTVSVVASGPGAYTVTDTISRDGCPGQCSLPVTVRGLPQICVTKEIACLLPKEVCAPFAKIARGVKSDSTCPAFCYRITVRNCGEVDLVNVAVTDDHLDLSGCSFPARINAGAAALECIVEGVTLCENTTNTVTASGQSVFDTSSSGFTSAQSSATGIVLQASIACDKIVTSPDDQDGVPENDRVQFVCGSGVHAIQYSVIVTNTGDADLENITISDPTLAQLCTLPGVFSLAAHSSINLPLCSLSFDCGLGGTGNDCANPLLGSATGCTVLQLGGQKVSITGPPGGIVGDICVGPFGRLSMSGEEFITGSVRLGPGATFSKSGAGTVGGVERDVDLGSEINEAIAASTNAAALPCTKTFGNLNKPLTITGNGGLNVICVQNITLSGGAIIRLDGTASDVFVINVIGKFALSGGSDSSCGWCAAQKRAL